MLKADAHLTQCDRTLRKTHTIAEGAWQNITSCLNPVVATDKDKLVRTHNKICLVKAAIEQINEDTRHMN